MSRLHAECSYVAFKVQSCGHPRDLGAQMKYRNNIGRLERQSRTADSDRIREARAPDSWLNSSMSARLLPARNRAHRARAPMKAPWSSDRPICMIDKYDGGMHATVHLHARGVTRSQGSSVTRGHLCRLDVLCMSRSRGSAFKSYLLHARV